MCERVCVLFVGGSNVVVGELCTAPQQGRSSAGQARPLLSPSESLSSRRDEGLEAVNNLSSVLVKDLSAKFPPTVK